MERSLTRRGLVAAAPAAVVATLPAPPPAPTPTRSCWRCENPYERTLAAAQAVSPAHSAAENAFYAARTAKPHLAERAWLRAVNANTAVIEQDH